MNIDKLNKKINMIFQAHSLLNRDSIFALEGAKIGIAEEYLRSKPFHHNLQALKHFLDAAKITAVIVFSGPLNLYYHFNQQRPPLMFNPYDFEYIVAPASSYVQLRYMYQQNFIQAIVALPQIIQYSASFKELNNFIVDLDIPSQSFSWVDIKAFTAKAQISLDAASELVLLFELASDIFKEDSLNQCAQSKFSSNYDKLKRRQKTDVAYSLAHSIFQGKNATFETRINKTPCIFKPEQVLKILNYYSFFRMTPVLQNNCEWYFPFEVNLVYTKIGPQLPTEILLMKSVGVGNNYHSLLLNQQKQLKHPSIELTILDIQNLNIQIQGIFTQQLHSSFRLDDSQIQYEKNYFSEELPHVGIQEAIQYYYEKLKLTSKQGSRKGSESPGEKKILFDQQPKEISLHQARLTSIMRLLTHFEILLPDKNKATVFSSGLRGVKAEHAEQGLLFVYLIQSEISYSLFHPLLDYYFQHDLLIQSFSVDQLGKYREIYQKNKASYPISKQTKASKEMQYQLIISRVFCLVQTNIETKVEEPQLLQFCEMCNEVYEHFRNVYEAILLGQIFELNDRKCLNAMMECGKSPLFRKEARAEYGQAALNFLNGKSDVTKEIMGEGLSLWNDFVQLANYLEQKKHKSQVQAINIASLMSEANEYLKEKLK